MRHSKVNVPELIMKSVLVTVGIVLVIYFCLISEKMRAAWGTFTTFEKISLAAIVGIFFVMMAMVFVEDTIIKINFFKTILFGMTGAVLLSFGVLLIIVYMKYELLLIIFGGVYLLLIGFKRFYPEEMKKSMEKRNEL